MNVTKRQKRRIRNLVCIQYSIVKMLLVIAGFELLGRGLSLMQGTQSATQEIEGEVIWSEETKTEENPLIVCVDAGHGGKDNGSDYKGRYEKDDNLKLAQAVSAYLADKNVKVVMTRSDDTFLRLSERCGIANQSGADYMLSLHRNDGEGNGVETWISASGSEETDGSAGYGGNPEKPRREKGNPDWRILQLLYQCTFGHAVLHRRDGIYQRCIR